MNKEKLDQTIECLMDKIEKECNKDTNNCEEILSLTKALTELVSARANFLTD